MQKVHPEQRGLREKRHLLWLAGSSVAPVMMRIIARLMILARKTVSAAERPSFVRMEWSVQMTFVREEPVFMRCWKAIV